MTTTDSGLSDAELREAQATWREVASRLISYRHLGTFSTAIGRHGALGEMKIRHDLRGPVGLLAAPLGIALLDTAGINVDAIAIVSPTRIDMHIFEPAADVTEIRLQGKIVREAKTQFFTEARITDAADPGRVIAVGGTHWSVGAPNPGFNYVDQRANMPTTADLPLLYEAFGARLRGDGNLEIPDLPPELGRYSLHQGPLQVVPEAAAMMAAREIAGTDQFWIEHQGTSIIARGTGAPLVTHAEVLRIAEGCINVRVELRAEGNDDRVIATTICRFRLV